MAKLIYLMLTSLDGYVADRNGDFGWAAPDAEVHAFINDLVRDVATFLYGRRMYDIMRAWEDMPAAPDQPQVDDFARLWRAADKVVYSRTLPAPASARTRIERSFDPDAVRRLKIDARSDLGIGGPELAAQAFAAGLIDEFHLFVTPVSVGSGKPVLPADLRLRFELLHARRFAHGTAHLHYRCRGVEEPRGPTRQ